MHDKWSYNYFLIFKNELQDGKSLRNCPEETQRHNAGVNKPDPPLILRLFLPPRSHGAVLGLKSEWC